MRQIKKVDVKINLIAIDFMDKYNLDHDDPDKPELYESLKSLMYIYDKVLGFLVQRIKLRFRIRIRSSSI